MKNDTISYHKYFPVSEDDIIWNLFIENIGFSNVTPYREYPLNGHPVTHYFTWGKGRYLNGYQMLFINRGKGVFESESAGRKQLVPGSIFLLYPHEWHRYRPTKSIGWEEYWIGFNGEFAKTLVENSFFTKTAPVIYLRNLTEILSLFETAIKYTREEKPGFQQIVAGITFQIFGHIQYSIRNKNFEGTTIEKRIDEARILMEKNISKNIDVSEIAEQLNVGYVLFRKKFKDFTGFSPKQYFIHLKLSRAKDMLLSSDLSVSEIAYQIGFESVHYFSKAFKEGTGISPSDFRGLVNKQKNK